MLILLLLVTIVQRDADRLDIPENVTLIDDISDVILPRGMSKRWLAHWRP